MYGIHVCQLAIRMPNFIFIILSTPWACLIALLRMALPFAMVEEAIHESCQGHCDQNGLPPSPRGLNFKSQWEFRKAVRVNCPPGMQSILRWQQTQIAKGRPNSSFKDQSWRISRTGKVKKTICDLQPMVPELFLIVDPDHVI